MDLGTVQSRTAERYPDLRAVGGPVPLTHREWDARTDRLARVLAAHGAGRGDRVALLMGGGEPLAGLHLAAQKIGAVSVPLSFRLGPEELAYCLADARPALLVTDAATEATADAAGLRAAVPRLHSAAGGPPGAPPPPGTVEHEAQAQPDGPLGVAVGDDDLSVMLYTSGTTGRPKGVPRTHRAEHSSAVAHLLQTRPGPFSRTLGVMPMFHTMGLRTLLACLVGAGTWVPQTRFDAEESLELIHRERVDSLYLVPTVYWSLLRTGRLHEAASVRSLAYAGAAMTPALAQGLVEALEPAAFVNHFGSTEIYTFSIGPDVAAKPGSAGRAGVFGRVRLVSPQPGASAEDEVERGRTGQIAVSMDNPEAFGGYWQRPDADAASIRGGWYFPGDLAVQDEDGDLWVSGRVDDMINSGGENIYPDEIEDALIRCPAVAEVAVAGLPDDRWGQAATAFVVPRTGTSAQDAVDEVVGYLRADSGLASLKRPKRVVAVAEIPKSAVGKLLRRRLTAGDFRALAEASTERGR
ncbi:AMP-binding protein [Streptomonospora halophila]|uniref:AMP-binding protein n=1 Tax=Streptomonospora halophila TaxID=427369 RepID=A0ABP9G9J5_9ACTN